VHVSSCNYKTSYILWDVTGKSRAKALFDVKGEKMIRKHSLVRMREGCYIEEYDITGWTSADWRKYHAFVRSLKNTVTLDPFPYACDPRTVTRG
jgi:hypothetical protein